MKKITTQLLLLITLLILSSCLLSKEEPFVCDKNTPVVINGENICGSTRVERHVVSTDLDPTEYETLRMRLDYSGIFRGLGITLGGKTIQEGTTYVPSEASYGGEGLSGSVEITITKMDRTARKISGNFSFTGEYTNPNTAVPSDRTETGVFTDVNY